MTDLEHHKSIMEMFNPFYESWMSEDDHAELVNEVLRLQGKTLKMLNDEIDIGISNGYTVEQQIDVIRYAITTFSDN